MPVPDETARPITPENMPAPHTLLERLADELGGRSPVTVVYGEPVTTEGVTIIPVTEIGFGFGFSGDPGHGPGEATTDQRGGAGGVRARPRGFIEIKNGTATYKPVRNSWLDVGVPLAALLVGTALPRLARRLAKRRLG